jgi:hypothetical protein
VAAWESITALVRDVEDRAALAEREAWERLLRLEAKSTTTPVEDFAQRIDLLEGKLAKAHQAQDVAEENSRGLSNAVADAERWQEESNRKCQEWVEELTLLQARGSELCQAIVGPPRVRSHLSEGMQIAALHHAKMAKQLVMLWAAVASAMEFVLVCSPTQTFQVEVVDDLVAEFQKQEERRRMAHGKTCCTMGGGR